MSDLAEKIKTVKELFFTARHGAMATVNEDGSPHNSPYFLMYDKNLKHLYWGSHVDSQHSQNVIRTGQLFVVVYDAFKKREGLYIKAINGHVVEEEELDEALGVHNSFRAKEGRGPLEKSYYSSNVLQRMWKADITQLWIAAEERDENGLRIKDYRYEITANDLLK